MHITITDELWVYKKLYKIWYIVPKSIALYLHNIPVGFNASNCDLDKFNKNSITIT